VDIDKYTMASRISVALRIIDIEITFDTYIFDAST